MLEYLHVECAPPMVQSTPYRAIRSQSGCTMHGRWYFYTEVTFCIYIFPETLGFWKRQVHWKPLSTRGTLYPFGVLSLCIFGAWKALKTLGFGALYPLKALVTCGNLSVPFKNRLALHPFLTIGTLGTLKDTRNLWNPLALEPWNLGNFEIIEHPFKPL